MKVRTLACMCLAVGLIAASSANSIAAGLPDRQTLDAMGLGGLIAMSDDEAMMVRGQGFKGKSSAVAYGASFARISGHGGSAGSVNGYNAKGKHLAGGANESEAGIVIIKSGRKGGHGGGGGGYGGGAMQSSRGGKGGHGGKGGKGGHGGKPSVKSVRVFAGGSSIAFAK
jgi:hypothetical protein